MAAFQRKQYAGSAVPTTTTSLLTVGGTSVTILATTGWPSQADVPFYVVIGAQSAYEEKCLATISGNTLTLTRAQDDTTAYEHAIGAKVYPVFTANDADEANELVSKLTTKGDLLVTDGSGLFRLGVGSDGYFLKANSSASVGVEWASIPTINNLDDVGDVTISDIEDGDILTYSTSASAWINETVHFLTVSDTAPNDEVKEGDLWYNSSELELYTYYSGSWIQVTLTPEFLKVEELDNVYADEANAGDVLAFDGLDWYNDTVSNLFGSHIIALSGDVSGSVMFDGSASVNISTSIQPNSVALGTDTTGNYMSALTQGTGVTITHTPSEGSNATIAIGQAVGTSASVTFANITTTGDLVVGGDLTVNGTTTTLNTETLEIEDNIIVLNSNVSTSPVLNAGIEIQRGTSDNVSVRWNETSDKWEITEDGSAYLEVATTADISTAALTSISDLPDVSTAYQIGSTGPAGGIIFITPDTTGNSTGKYFEVAPSASQVQRSWATGGNQSSAVSGADATGFGFGAQNTIDIVAQSGNVSATSAAAYASGYEYGGFSDWFLPSIDELQELYAVEDLDPGIIPGLLSNNYWSSTEHSATQAKYENLGDGGQGFSAKSNALYVRPVRAFDSPASGDFLKWNGSAWVNDAIDLGLDDLSDVDASAPLSNGNPLVYDNNTSTWTKGTNYLSLDNNDDTSYLTLDTTNGLNVNTGTSNTSAEYAHDGISIYDYNANTIVTLTADNGLNITDSSNNYVNLSTTSIRFSTPENAASYYINPLGASVGQVFAVVPNQYSEPGGTFSPTTLNLDSLGDVSAPTPTSGDLLKWNGTAWVNDAIDLGTDTTGNYMSDLTQGTGVTITHTPGEGSNATIAIGQDVSTSSSVTFANVTTTGNVAISGRIDKTTVRESVADVSVSASVVTANYATGDIFYLGTAPSSNFTLNLTNAPTDNGKAITVVLFVTQGATGYYPSVVKVAGVEQEIKWANFTSPTPSSGNSGAIDIFSFTFVRRSSAWTVFGSSNLGYMGPQV